MDHWPTPATVNLRLIRNATAIELGLFIALLVPLVLCWKLWLTYRCLKRSGLPTVFWRPKFVNYDFSHDSTKKLSASNITNILPRMQRLQGPYQMYGTVYGISTAVVHIAHTIPAMTILSESTDKTPAYNHFKNFCGEGVFTADGEDWCKKRAAVLHVVLRRGKGSFYDRVQAAAGCALKNLCETLDRTILAEAPDDEQSVKDIVPILQHATIGLIFQFITHTPINDLNLTELSDSDDTNTTESRGNHLGHSNGKNLITSYLQSITRIRMIILAQSRSIWFLLPRWCYSNFAAMYRLEEETMDSIRVLAKHAVKVAKVDSPLQILQQMPLYNNHSSGCFSKNIIDECITLLFAGQDTSAATLSWTLHLISVYPEVQEKLAKEVSREMNGVSLVSKKEISRMPYLDAVIKESMRLYPVAPFVVRKVGKDIRIAYPKHEGGLEGKSSSLYFPEGALACIWIYSLHRNPIFWEKPNNFLPDRWLQKNFEVTPGSYMPFATGSRNCIGQPIANIILRTLLAGLIYRYEFRDPRLTEYHSALAQSKNSNKKKGVHLGDRFRKEMQAGFTVLPEGGLQLQILHRKH